MIVLDVVDAGARETRRELGKLRRRQALRLERRAGQSAHRRADPPPQCVEPVARAGEGRDQLGRERDVGERHVLVQRRIAEQHVEELPGILPDGRRGERDAHLEVPTRDFDDRLDAADDLGADEIVGDGQERHFHALLDRDGARALLDCARLAADVIDGLQAFLHSLTSAR
jgi:hypothetical protein